MKLHTLFFSILLCFCLVIVPIHADMIAAPFLVLFSPFSILLLIVLAVVLAHLFHTISAKRKGDD